MRCEYRFSSGEHLAIISNPVSGELIFLNDDDRVAQLEHEDAIGAGYGWAFHNCIPHYTEERQILFGLLCRRVLLKDCVSKQDAGEIWISDEFMLVVKDINGNHDWRITRWESAEPSPSLFQIPDGYRVVAQF
jgi:hypothetical protein